MHNITIQLERGPLSDSDLAAFISLITQLMPDCHVSKEHVDALLASPADHTLLARNETGTIVGTARLHVRPEVDGRSGNVDDVVVDQAHRGQGIGRALMEHLYTLAEEKQLRWVELNSQHIHVEAHHLYRSLGYIEEDTAVFSKDLD
jgi:ribosomal protein S18 acetylase RimI-like enzyme